MSSIFGGNTGLTYEQVQRRRQMADAMMAPQGTPRNVGEGISSFARQITGALVGRRAAKQDDELRAKSDEWFQTRFGGGSQPAAFEAAPVSTPAVSTQAIRTPEQQVGADTREALVRTGLIDRGLPEHVADAFVMNFRDESNLDPGINEIEPLVPGSRGGFGLAQWTGPRRRQLEAFAAERGTPVSDMNTQLDFLMEELQGPESRAAQTIMSSRDAPTAAAAIVNDFLRPAEVNRAKREAQYTGGGQARPQQNTPQMAQIVQALSDPYIRQDPGKMMVLQSLLQQNLQANDPMRALEMERAQLELAQMRQPQPGFSILSPEEKAQLGLPADAPLQRGPDGRITQIGGGGTNVNVNTGQNPDVFQEELDKASAGMFVELYDQLPTAQNKLVQVQNLERLLSGAETGMGAAFKTYLGEFGIETEGLSDLQAAQAAINRLVPEQRQPGSGPMSDADLELFKQSLPRLINTPQGNSLIVRTMRGLAEYEAEQAAIAARVVSGDLSRTEGQEALMNLRNPLADFDETVSQIGEQGSTGNARAVPESPQEDAPDFATMTVDEIEAWLAENGG